MRLGTKSWTKIPIAGAALFVALFLLTPAYLQDSGSSGDLPHDSYTLSKTIEQPEPELVLSTGSWTENRGQVPDDSCLFYSKGTPTSVILGPGWFGYDISASMDDGTVQGVFVLIRLVGSTNVSPVGVDAIITKKNYITSPDRESWITGVRNFEEVVYYGVYEGINLRCYFLDGHFKYEFIVQPGGDYSSIVMEVLGHDSIMVEPSTGSLVIRTPFGDIKDNSPISYSLSNGLRCGHISCFEHRGPSSIGFFVQDAPTKEILVIDPTVEFSSYIGGDGTDFGWKVTEDTDGDIYITGYSMSRDFPTTPGVYNRSNNGNGDVFVTKVVSKGDVIRYSTFIGGDQSDVGKDIVVDALGNAYITGYTLSKNFPVSSAAYDREYAGDKDVFVLGLDPTGEDLMFSTYLGGVADESGNGIALGSDGTILVTGFTHSSAFPTTTNALDGSFNGDSDVFLCRLSTDGSTLDYSTFIGGVDSETANDIVMDGQDGIFITGNTSSGDYPVTPGSADTEHNQWVDVFVTKLAPNCSALEYSTFIGGRQDDEIGRAIVLDGSGCAYVTGETHSSDFPTTLGAYDRTFDGRPGLTSDVFVFKLNENGSRLEFSTFLGGTGSEIGYHIAINKRGMIYVTGRTGSDDLPTSLSPFDDNLNGSWDAFVSQLNNLGDDLTYCSYFGGNGSDMAYGMVLADRDLVLLTGTTGSVDLPRVEGLKAGHGGMTDVFLTCMDVDAPWIVSDNTPDSIPVQGIFEFNFTLADNVGVASATVNYRYSDGTVDTIESLVYQSGDAANGTWVFQVTIGPVHPGNVSYRLNVTDVNGNLLITQVLEIIVKDTGLPKLRDITVGQPTTGDPFRLDVGISDETGVEQVLVEYWFGHDSGSRVNVSMSPVAIDARGRGNYTITSLMVPSDSLEPLNYYFVARDDYMHWNRTLPISLNVTDNDGPEFTGDGMDPQATTGDPFTFVVRVVDNIEVMEVRCLLWRDGSSVQNLSMVSSSDIYTLDNITIPPNSVKNLLYQFYSVDTYGNINMTPIGVIPVVDNDPPSIIVDLSDEIAFTNATFHFSVETTDNIAATRAWVNHSLPDGTWDVIELSGGSVGPESVLFTGTIDVPDYSIAPIQYTIKVEDAEGNQFMGILTQVEVLDGHPPMIDHDASDEIAWMGTSYHFEVKVTDNIGVSDVWVDYLIGEVGPKSIALDRKGAVFTMDIDVPKKVQGVLSFRFRVSDAAMNENSTPYHDVQVKDPPPNLTGVPLWVVVEEEESLLDLSPYFEDPNDGIEGVIIEVASRNVTWSAPKLVAYYEEWSPDRIIELSISDETTTIYANLSMRIINVNDSPRPPVIVTPSNGSIYDEGQGVALDVELYDPDPGQLLEIMVNSSVDGTVLTFPSTHQGPITITGLNAGTHVLRVTVSDGEASAYSEVTIIVKQKEEPPVYREPGVLLIVLTTLIIVSALTIYSWRRRNLEKDKTEL